MYFLIGECVLFDKEKVEKHAFLNNLACFPVRQVRGRKTHDSLSSILVRFEAAA